MASDVRTGAVMEVWLAEFALSPGAFAVVTTARQSTLVDWMEPAEVTAARRAEQRQSARRRLRERRAAARVARRTREVAAEVVRAAEALTRGR